MKTAGYHHRISACPGCQAVGPRTWHHSAHQSRRLAFSDDLNGPNHRRERQNRIRDKNDVDGAGFPVRVR